MASVSGLVSYPRNANGHELKGAVNTQQTNLKQPRNPFATGIEKPLEPHPQSPSDQNKAVRRAAIEGDRRKVCQRFIHRPVLIEFRSGINRRRRNSRECDIVEHISVKV